MAATSACLAVDPAISNSSEKTEASVTFIEECVKRKAHIFFHEDNGIEIRWNETPGKKMILAGLSSITEELSGNFLYNSLLGDHNISGKVEEVKQACICLGGKQTKRLAG